MPCLISEIFRVATAMFLIVLGKLDWSLSNLNTE